MFKKKNILDKKARIRTAYELEIRKKEFLEICSLLDKLNFDGFLEYRRFSFLVYRTFATKMELMEVQPVQQSLRSLR